MSVQPLSTVRPLSTRQTTALFVDTDHSYTHLVSVWIFDAESGPNGSIDQQSLEAWMIDQLDVCPIFRRKVYRMPFDLGFPCWVTDRDLDIRRHITVTGLSTPGWRGLTDEIVRIANRPMDRSRPLWELHVINDITGAKTVPDGASAVILKFHHSVGDGVESVALARRLFGDPNPSWPVLDSARPKFRVWQIPELTLRQVRQARRATAETKAAQEDLSSAVESGRVAPTPASRPSTRFNRVTSGKWTFDVVLFSLTDVQAIRRAVENVTVNDVMLTVVAIALSSYLDTVGDTPPTSMGSASPKSVFPVKQRVSEPEKGSNQFSTMLVDLHPESENPVDRLRSIAHSASLEKSRIGDPRSVRVEHTMDHWPMWLVKYAMWRQKRHAARPTQNVGATVVVTNVPRGSSQGLSFFGRSAIDGFGVLGTCDQSGLQHVVSSLGDRISVSFTACAEAMPDSSLYAEAITRAFRDLQQASTGSGGAD